MTHVVRMATIIENVLIRFLFASLTFAEDVRDPEVGTREPHLRNDLREITAARVNAFDLEKLG